MAKRSSLGKGLGSLIGEASVEVGSTPDATIAIDTVVPNASQPRKNFDEQQLEELTDSIKQNGILQPILVRKQGTKYEIVAGERRYQAAKRAGLNEVPVLVRDISDEDVFKLALIENLQRSDLNPLEEAQGYQMLIERDNLTQEELGRLLSKSRSTIANTLRLLDLPEEVQEYMIEGKLTAGHARAILAVAGEDGKRRLAQKVVEENLTVRKTESLAPLFSGNTSEKVAREPQPQSYRRVAKELKSLLSREVKVKRLRNKNRIEIEFADEDDLMELLELFKKDGE